MEEAKDKAIKRLKDSAMDWYKNQKENVEVQEKEYIPESESNNVELDFVRALKKLIMDSELDRKSVLLVALANQERSLERGIAPEKLPEVVRNISRKPEIKSKVISLSKYYRIGNSDLCYLWGLEDER